MSKEIISESRLREIISEEAIRFKKKLTLEAEKKKLLSRLNEMYTEEEMLDEVSPDEAAHADAIKFLASHPQAEAVKNLYKSYKNGDALAGKKLIPWILNYAQKSLNKDKDGASDFLKDISRVLDDEISRAVKSSTGFSGGAGA